MEGSRSRDGWSFSSEFSGSIAAGSAEGAGADGSALLGSSFFSGAGAALSPASSREKDSKAETSAPSSIRTAMGC
jgi:type IV secretory pathway VirB6-like protein